MWEPDRPGKRMRAGPATQGARWSGPPTRRPFSVGGRILQRAKTWMAGTSAAMTWRVIARPHQKPGIAAGFFDVVQVNFGVSLTPPRPRPPLPRRRAWWGHGAVLWRALPPSPSPPRP